nr:hypothetical protein L321_13816 [Pseudomonas plecoglossicida NB2011]
MERAFRFVRHLLLPLGRLSRFPVYARCSFQPSTWAHAYPSSGLVGHVPTQGSRSLRGVAARFAPGAGTPPARAIRGATVKTSRAWADF